nr:DegV family protein [uncultured Blautia sp.]
MMKTAIMTDTNSGITKDIAKELGIYVIPMPVIIDEETYYENDTITEEEFFCALSGDRHITTSQPSPGDVMDLWDQILNEGYDELVYIPMSSGLSNSCAAALGYSQEYDGKVEVIDNHRISVTMYQSVLHARDLALQGASAKEIKTALEDDAYNSSIYLAVNTLEYLKKGGRITPAAALIGSVLSIKPILTIQGEKLDSYAKTRGSMKKAEEKMLSAVQSDIEKRFASLDQTKLHIGAAGAGLTVEQQEEWVNLLRSKFPGADIFYSPLSASISVHTGPGAVGIGISFR